MSIRARCILFVLLLALVLAGAWAQEETARSVILVIGDGMGFEQVRAGHLFAGGELSFEELEVAVPCATFAEGGSFDLQWHAPGELIRGSTDSAAAATALATGRKTANGRISTSTDGEESFSTILEICAEAGMRTGLVTTVPLTHATPAAFAAHRKSRREYHGIADDYLNGTRPDVLLRGWHSTRWR